MESKQILTAGALLAILLGVAVALGMFKSEPAPVVVDKHEESQMAIYSSQDFGISFQYPDTYRLEERIETYEGNPLLVVTLVDKNAVVPDMSEGPTVISLLATKKDATTTLEDWVKTKSIANFNISLDQRLVPTTVGGEQALAYRYDGLYTTDATAALHNENAYLFSVGWIAEDQPIRHDFEHVLESVSFN